MKSKLLALLVFSTLLISACVQNNNDDDDNSIYVTDTIYPKDYLSIYPGSWFEYKKIRLDPYSLDTLLNGIFRCHVDSIYKPHSYLQYDGSQSQIKYVPFYDGSPYYGYQKPSYVNAYHQGVADYYALYPQFSDYVGATYVTNFFDTHIGDIRCQYTVSDKYDEGGESYVIIKGKYSVGPYKNCERYEKWQKGVGKIISYTFNTISNDTIIRSKLVDYSVAPH